MARRPEQPTAPSPSQPPQPPVQVQVLLATYNGRPWLAEQLATILGQTQVEVSVLVSDDHSSDGTRDALEAYARREPRLTLLPAAPRCGHAAGHFYRLLHQADAGQFRYFAFADQDDLWDLDKLIRHVGLLQATGAAAVSSDVLAFWPDGRQRLIIKSRPQRRWDHLFEPPGPGCSFLMTAELVRLCQHWLPRLAQEGRLLDKHDWLV